ncbi:MAG: DUF4911 domain-containing protein [Deltaproteobacteria bacterium]|nr:DUF4911 domain-containing protein [Deltaproteobacteria bacterium]
MHYLFYKVNKADIFMIKFLLEGYENMAQVSTIDEDLPKIQISVVPDLLDECLVIIDDLKKRFFMQQLDEDCTKSQGNY